MASLPQLAVHSDSATLSLSFPDALVEHHAYGSFETHHASAMSTRLTSTLRSLRIFLGPGLGPCDDLALASILENIAIRCPSLAFFSITSYADSWTKWRAALVSTEIPSSVLRTMHIVDPEQNSEASIIVRADGTNVCSASLPLCRLNDESILAALSFGIWQLRKLIITPSAQLAVYLANRDAILTNFGHFTLCLKDLRQLSLPLDFSADLVPILYLVSALPRCTKLEFTSSPAHLSISQFQFPIIRLALVEGLYRFNHLKVLSLPAGALCESLHTCLGDLGGLQNLKIVADTMSTILRKLPTPRPGQFSGLRMLQILGSFTHMKWVLRAFSSPAANSIRSIYVESESILTEYEVGKAFCAMKRRCPIIEELGICIKSVHVSERADWLDLSLLRTFTLKDFVIQHPRPLVLSDSDILALLMAWPKAKHVSLNPRPSLSPWYIHSGATSTPTLDCLRHVVERGYRLRHFGVHLNPRFVHSLKHCRRQPRGLRELDLGSRCNKRDVALIRELLPQATLL